jgi:hypothetical protein
MKAPIPEGQKFGHLTVEGQAPLNGRDRHARVYAKCDCGNVRDFPLGDLRRGRSTHCGCLLSERLSDAKTIHGQYMGGGTGKMAGTLNGMIQRCYNSTAISYERYAARGITVCDRWRFGENGKRGLECFIEDMGDPPSSAHSLDRINNDGNYEPSNCRWATRQEQQNNRRSNALITFNGRTQTLAQWARELGLNYEMLHKRIGELKWSPEAAFTTKVGARRS